LFGQLSDSSASKAFNLNMVVAQPDDGLNAMLIEWAPLRFTWHTTRQILVEPLNSLTRSYTTSTRHHLLLCIPVTHYTRSGSRSIHAISLRYPQFTNNNLATSDLPRLYTGVMLILKCFSTIFFNSPLSHLVGSVQHVFNHVDNRFGNYFYERPPAWHQPSLKVEGVLTTANAAGTNG
jgi:hypothetical protein